MVEIASLFLKGQASMNNIFTNHNISFTLSPEGGILFVDHQKNDRSGHFGHAMVQCANGDVLCFYPNCNNDVEGHSGRGWMEYQRSTDGGLTFAPAQPLPYSQTLYDLNIGTTSMNEKAVCTPKGTVLLFNIICDVSTSAVWEPYLRPTYLRSTDNGYTWEQAKIFCDWRGRIYDVQIMNEKIYVLMGCGWNTPEEENCFRLYVSEDDGITFREHSKLPFEAGTMKRFYGTMEQLQDGRLIIYTYNPEDENNLDYVVANPSLDGWSEVRHAYFARRIRNPQMISFKGSYFIFGRSGQLGKEEDNGHVICYCSKDGINWDEGRYVIKRTAGIGAYSNTLRVTFGGVERVLYQTSHAYHLHQTNILHFWLDGESIES